jgi:DNA-binding NarL/FixJ family response regulator
MDPDHVSVVIVDDHSMVAEGLAGLLRAETDLEVVGSAASVADCLAVVERTRPNVVLMDYHLPDGTGADATKVIKARWPEVKVIMLTGSGANEALASAIEAGCAGFLVKELRGPLLASAIRSVNRGELVIHAGAPNQALPNLQRATTPPHDLTRRELDVLSLLSQGASTHGVASELYLSHNTVRNHIRNILSKLGGHSKLEAVSIALRERIINPDGSVNRSSFV